MAKSNWHKEHPGGGGKAREEVRRSKRIDPAEAQRGANKPRKPSHNYHKEHPGG